MSPQQTIAHYRITADDPAPVHQKADSPESLFEIRSHPLKLLASRQGTET
jgi:hypothetical protein